MSEAGLAGLTGEPGATVLVTGAAGFLGSRVVELLSRSDCCEALATDVVEGAELERLPRVRFRVAELRDRDALEDLVRQATHLVHLAALAKRGVANRCAAGLDVNVGATSDPLGLAARHDVRGVAYGSSDLMYGGFQCATPRSTSSARLGRASTSTRRCCVCTVRILPP